MRVVVGHCVAAGQTRVTRGRLSKGSYLYRSQPSHFSSCLTTLTLETPQFALLDAAQGALSVVEWPQLYWCTTLVHMLARTGEQGALHSGGRLVRASLRIVGEEGGRGVEGDERFHGAVTAASHSLLLARLMDEIGDLIKETRLESLGQPGRPQASLAGHRAIAEAIRAGDPAAAAAAMHAHVEMVSDVALLREQS